MKIPYKVFFVSAIERAGVFVGSLLILCGIFVLFGFLIAMLLTSKVENPPIPNAVIVEQANGLYKVTCDYSYNSQIRLDAMKAFVEAHNLDVINFIPESENNPFEIYFIAKPRIR